MEQELKQIQCDDQCGFMIRSHDEKEIMDAARSHVTTVHKMTVTDSDLRAKMKPAPVKTGSRS